MTREKAIRIINRFNNGNDVAHPVLHPAMDYFFKMVQPKTNWKDAIDGWIECIDIDYVRIAVMFFTATELKTMETENGKIHVSAAGYWAGPCN